MRFKNAVLLTILFTLLSCATQRLSEHFPQHGLASWYGRKFQKHKTASGERFDMNALTAAHRSVPFGTKLRVRCPSTGKEVIVRVNDRGPFVEGRVLDLSFAAAKQLGIIDQGEAEVEIDIAG